MIRLSKIKKLMCPIVTANAGTKVNVYRPLMVRCVGDECVFWNEVGIATIDGTDRKEPTGECIYGRR